MQAPWLTEEEQYMVIDWIDKIPFSRTKKNLNRDFADGVLIAELVDNQIPTIDEKRKIKTVDLHNYPTANSSSKKYSNWNTLNNKVFKKHFDFEVNKTDIEEIIAGCDKVILRVLRLIYLKIEAFKAREAERKQRGNSKEETSQQRIDLSLSDKDLAIKELRETIEILELKLKKMDQLKKLKDAKIQTLESKLNQSGNR